MNNNYNRLLESFGIDNKLHKDSTPVDKPKHFNKVKQNIAPFAGCNYMADLLFLPETKDKYKYLFVIVDLATDRCDFEPLRTKDAHSVLNAFKQVLKRNFLPKPQQASVLRTDPGGEFKGEFEDYLFKNNILHTVAMKNRHEQMSCIERLNRTLGQIINGYMNSVELKTKKIYRDWTTIDLNQLRKKLNLYREKQTPKNINEYVESKTFPSYSLPDELPKFHIGELVYTKLMTPHNALGHSEQGKFREGDVRWDIKNPKKISQVLYYPGKVSYRYMVQGVNNVSYQDCELKPVHEGQEEVQEVKEIIGRKKVGNRYFYKVWWKGERKNQATWEPETNLIEDGLGDELNEYDQDHPR